MTTMADFNKTDLVDDHTAKDHNDLAAATLRAEFSNTESISATKQLLDGDTPIQIITASTTDRDVELAAENATNNHLTAILNATTDNNVVVKDDSGVTTLGTLEPDDFLVGVPFGTKWKVLKPRAATVSQDDAVAGTATDERTWTAQRVQQAIASLELLFGRYKLATGISSDDLVLTFKDLDNNDFGTTNTLTIKIGDTEHTVNSVMNLTIADGANWANLGSTEHATQDVDLFAYIVNQTGGSAGLKLAWSRIPYGQTVGDFSSTSTDENYLAGPSTYTATDKVVLVGRFNATLSAGAGYTWTIPGTSVIISHPITYSRWMTYSPTWTVITAGDGVSAGQYRWAFDKVTANPLFTFGSTSAMGAGVPTATLPFGRGSYGGVDPTNLDGFFENNGTSFDGAFLIVGASVVNFYVAYTGGSYFTFLALSSTIPFAWAVDDKLFANIEYRSV